MRNPHNKNKTNSTNSVLIFAMRKLVASVKVPIKKDQNKEKAKGKKVTIDPTPVINLISDDSQGQTQEM